jgi:hypothetical protein
MGDVIMSKHPWIKSTERIEQIKAKQQALYIRRSINPTV